MPKEPKAGEIYKRKDGRKRYAVIGTALHKIYGYPKTLVIFKPVIGWKWHAETLDDFMTDYIRV